MNGPHVLRFFTQQEKQMNISKIAIATVLGIAVIGGTMSATTPAYAYHNNVGHFAAGLGVGFLFGRALRPPVYAAPPPVYVAPAPVYGGGFPPEHYNWCFRNYRSYWQPSNSYQPYQGPRRICRSPWG
jgi:hypothetical protein